MKILKFTLFFLCINGCFLKLQAQKAVDSCVVHIVLIDKLLNNIPNCKFQILTDKDQFLQNSETNAQGEATLKLKKNSAYQILIPKIYNTLFKSTFDVSSTADVVNYKFSISESPATALFNKVETARVTVIIQNDNHQNYSNQKFSLFSGDDKFIKEYSTDSTGKCPLSLEKGKKFILKTTIQNLPFTTDFKVPEDVNAFIFRFLISIRKDISKSSVAPANTAKTETNVSKRVIQSTEKVKLKIRVTDENKVSEENAMVSLLDSNVTIYKSSTDIDGYCFLNVEQHKDYHVWVEKFGKKFPFQLNLPKDQELDSYFLDIVIKVITSYIRTYTLENVYFDFDKWDIREDAIVALTGLLKEMKGNPKMKIEIAGHTDADGKDDYNMQLSQHRANSVVNWLVKNGISSKRLLAKGYGKTQPISTNETVDGRQKNRRTEVRVIEE